MLTLVQLKNLIHHTVVTKKVKNNINPTEDFSFGCNPVIAMNILQIADTEDTPDVTGVEAEIWAADKDKRQAFLNSITVKSHRLILNVMIV